MLQKRLNRRDQGLVAAIASSDQDVPKKPLMASAAHRCTGEMAAKTGIIKPKQIRQRRQLTASFCHQLLLTGKAGKFVPWADGQTIITAKNPIADRRAKFPINDALMFDCQIRDTPPRIQPVRRGKRIRRANIKTLAATTAMIGLRLIITHYGIGKDHP